MFPKFSSVTGIQYELNKYLFNGLMNEWISPQIHLGLQSKESEELPEHLFPEVFSKMLWQLFVLETTIKLIFKSERERIVVTRRSMAPAGILALWLQRDSEEGRGEGGEVDAGAEERKTEALVWIRDREIERKTNRGRKSHWETCTMVDRDKGGVGEGKEGRQVFELAANSPNPWGFLRARE